MKKLLLVIIFLSSHKTFSQTAASYVVMIQAKIIDTNEVRLRWDLDASAFSISVYRKTLTGQSWGSPIVNLSGTDTAYTDIVDLNGQTHEYRIVRSTNAYTAYGYALVGREYRGEVFRGDALLIVESEIDSLLQVEVETLVSDMEADGWRVTKYSVAQDTTVPYVKGLITSANSTLPQLKLVYLLGHVPVPYSGNLAPDGHPDHVGAWPADVYYAELNDLWTDQSVNTTSASQVRNQNIPGDGKLDQSVLPGNTELMIGRVDFSNLPVFTMNELELTKAYLNRVHVYKHGQNKLEKRAVIDDNFGAFGGEAFASNGWRNFAPLIGRENIIAADYRSTLNTGGYLFSYGCGGGSFTSAGGIGTSIDFAGDSLQTGFTMLFGSYFGDWDSQNNFMRSALAQGNTMSISWAGRPHWQYHTMAMGYPIGYSAWMSQNNASLYTGNYAMRGVHVALLGDPTLRMEYIASPTNVQVDSLDTFHISVSWTASTDSVDGYNIYRSQDGSPYFKMNEGPLTITSYIDSCVLYQGNYTYLVKSTKLTENFSGSYWNESLGQRDSVLIMLTKLPGAAFYSIQYGDNAPINFYAFPNKWTTSLTWLVDSNVFFGDTVIYYEWPSQNAFQNIPYNLVVSNECISDTLNDEYFGTIEGVNELLQYNISIYPNPINVGNELKVTSTLRVNNFSILTNDGRSVYQMPEINEINIPILASGIYLVKVETERGALYSKLIIE